MQTPAIFSEGGGQRPLAVRLDIQGLVAGQVARGGTLPLHQAGLQLGLEDGGLQGRQGLDQAGQQPWTAEEGPAVEKSTPR